MTFVMQPTIALAAATLFSFIIVSASPGHAQDKPPAMPPQTLSMAETRAIIEGAIAYAREKGMRMGVVVVDASGDQISGDRMDGASSRNVRFAEAKAFASAMYRQTTETLGALY